MRKLFALLVLICFPNLTFSQYIEVQDNFTAQQLVEDVLINSPCANVSNFSASGWDQFPSYGYFSAGTSTFPFEDGVLLTTGRAISAIGPNNSLLSEGTTSWLGDIDLEQAIGESNTINATVLEFDFLPIANKIIFEYIFSSEQYFDYSNPSQCNFSDGFAFLLREAGTQNQYQNLAVVPGTNIPVKITTIRGEGTICPAANPQFFDAYNGFEHPTNYNGQTKILRAEALVEPGTLYHIKLVVADQQNPLYDSAIFLGGGSFSVENDLGPDRLLATGNPVCFGESLLLDATYTGNNQYQWFRNGIAIPGETNPTYEVTEEGYYEVDIDIENNTCNIKGSITIEYAPAIQLQDSTLIQCDQDESGIAVFNLFNAAAQITGGDNSLQVTSFYTTLNNALNNTSPIPNPNSYTNSTPNQVIYARVMSPEGCTSVATLTLSTITNFIEPVELIECSFADNPNRAQFNLNPVYIEIQSTYGTDIDVSFHISMNNALQGIQALPFVFTNTIPGMQTIYARLSNELGCFGILPIYLTVVPTPQFSGYDEITYCLDTFPYPIMLSSGVVGNPSNFNFLWNTGETTPTILINQPGIYSVEVSFSQNHNGQTYTCSSSKTITVLGSEIAQLSYELSGNYGSQTVTINAVGTGDYVYAINNINGPYQESNVFENLRGGVYMFYVKDLNGCGIANIRVFLLGFPNYFTPNNDGVNDFWTIKGVNLRDNFIKSVVIYDRYGKILHWVDFNTFGWDGTYRGRPLPSSDYWFLATFVDGSTYRGHFTLKR
jgi:gliding motility-associated-like protein